MTAETSGCPYCLSPLIQEVRPFSYHGFRLGNFEMLVCSVCRRVFHPAKTADAIEQAARSKGLFARIPIDGGNSTPSYMPEHDVTIEVVQDDEPPSTSREGEPNDVGAANRVLDPIRLQLFRASEAANCGGEMVPAQLKKEVEFRVQNEDWSKYEFIDG